MPVASPARISTSPAASLRTRGPKGSNAFMLESLPESLRIAPPVSRAEAATLVFDDERAVVQLEYLPTFGCHRPAARVADRLHIPGFQLAPARQWVAGFACGWGRRRGLWWGRRYGATAEAGA